VKVPVLRAREQLWALVKLGELRTGLGTDGLEENRGGYDRGGLPEGDNGWGGGQPNRRGLLFIAAHCVGATRACTEGKREVTARRGGRATGVHTRHRGTATKEVA
jgi:hypothetical protein